MSIRITAALPVTLVLSFVGSAWADRKPFTAEAPLTEIPGDPLNGRAVVLDRERGHCLLCHQIASVDEAFQGTIGPDLSLIGERLSEAQLRFRIVDSRRLNPQTVMPAYHDRSPRRQVAKAFKDKPVLTAQETEDVIAYLLTLRAKREESDD